MGFVQKSGGLAKVEALYEAIKAIPYEECASYVRRAVVTDHGARQMLAFALLGMMTACKVATHAETKP